MINSKISLVCVCITALYVISVSFVLVTYNFETHFWYDTPYFSGSYYTFHPHQEDSCETLKSKFDLFHPNGSNPIRFEIVKEMFEKECEVVIIVP